jgi:molybdate transport system substrate-binding protein
VQSGNAQVGIIAQSLALSPAMKNGKSWLIPAATHPPLEQAAVLLKSSSSKSAARAFLDFLKTPSARATLSSYGFSLPEVSSPAASH